MYQFKTRYKIVRDSYAGYEVLCKLWFLPFWKQLGGTNTYRSYERALEYIKEVSGKGFSIEEILKDK